MSISFSKYHGTGNDFIMIDDRDESFDETNTELVRAMCSRRFGIGADGLILLRNEPGYDFKMVYFNADGNVSSMCGNGGRCLVKFAHSLDVFEKSCKFIAVDGSHDGEVLDNGEIKLKMIGVDTISQDEGAFILDTGSPHYVVQVNDVDGLNVKTEGVKIRYSEKYAKEGINVNFIQVLDNRIKVATYERGVEDETYSCGTGVTASAIVLNEMYPSSTSSSVSIETKGGHLKVYFAKNDDGAYSEIYLQGPAVKSFEGSWPI